MKQHTKWFATALAVASGLVIANSAQAQGITGTPYLSNINPGDPSYSGNWATTATITSTPTGLEFAASGVTGSFSTMYYAIPAGQQTALNPADTQVTFGYIWNSPVGPTGGVNVLFALDDSMGGVNYYQTGYIPMSAGSHSMTFALQSANLANVGAGAIINGMNFQIDPANVGGPYDITYSSLTLSPAPEPATLALVGLGAAGLLAFRRRK
jgi:hypothetical protein